jgi:hypothetical protein
MAEMFYFLHFFYFKNQGDSHINMKRQFFALTAIAVFLAAMFMIPPSSGAQTVTLQTQRDGARKGTPTARTATWTGNGAYYDEGDFTLSDSRCEESEGAPYLYWVLTAGGRETINGATITIDGSGPYTMTRQANGSFKYTQTFGGTPESFVDPVNVTAAYTRAKSANLVISHGCTGEVPVVPSFSLSFEEGTDGLYSFIGTDCVEDGKGENFGFFGEYEGQTFEVCATPTAGYNLALILVSGSTITSSPEANCTPYTEGDLTSGKLEGPAGADSDIWLCLVTAPNTIFTISAGGEPPPPPPVCDPNPTQLEYKTVFRGISGSYGAETFTNETLTLSAVGNVADVFLDGIVYKIQLPAPKTKITISNTSLNESIVDNGLALGTVSFGTEVLFWQFITNPLDVAYAVFSSTAGVPEVANRLTSCWVNSNGDFTPILEQWNENEGIGSPGVKVGGTLVIISTPAASSGYMMVGPAPSVTSTEVRSFKR